MPVELKLHANFNTANVTIDVPLVEKDVLLKGSDFISLHIPGGGETAIGEKEFDLMKDGAVSDQLCPWWCGG